MQSDYLHHLTATNRNADHFLRDENDADAFLLSSAPANPDDDDDDVELVEAKEHDNRKHAEIRDDVDGSSSHIDGTTHTTTTTSTSPSQCPCPMNRARTRSTKNSNIPIIRTTTVTTRYFNSITAH